MADTSASLLVDAQRLAADRSFTGELARVRAKATLAELMGHAPTYDWAYIPAQIVRNALFLHEVSRAAVNAGAAPEDLSAVPLVSARAWEALAALEEGVARPLALINAAVEYELAGFQANAACLARSSTPRQSWEAEPTIEGLAAAFIQRLLVRVRSLVPLFIAEPQGEEQELSERLANGSRAALAAALDSASLFLLSGEEEELRKASARLAQARRGYLALGDVAHANLVSNLEPMLPVMAARSTWRILRSRHNSPRWERYLKSLARGLGTAILESRSISELWPSQLGAIGDGLLDDAVSKVVRMPTSAGKTRVAELAIVDRLVARPGSKALYIAPYRALVSEVEESFSNLFADVGYSSTSILGAYEQGVLDADLAREAQVLVLTPEKADLLLRVAPEQLAAVGVVVLDEGQVVGDVSRGVKYEFLVSRLRSLLPDARFLLLSSVVSNQTLSDLAAWLRGSSADAITSDWRPALQRVARLDWSGSIGKLVYSGGAEEAALDRFIPNIVHQRAFEVVSPKTGRRRTVRYPGTSHRAQIAAGLAYELSSRGTVLIFCMQTDWVESAAYAVSDRIELAVQSGEEVPACFRLAEPPRSQSVAAEWLGTEHRITQLLGAGIGVHHSRLPSALRLAIEEDVRMRRLAVLAATTTLAQGVNLPVRTVIFHSCQRYDEELERQVLLPAVDYWNMAGRAGRAGAETEGTVVHLSLGTRDQDIFRYYLSHRGSVEDLESRLLVMLRQLTDQRLSLPDAAARLDPEILGLLVEESVNSAEALDQLLEGTLAAYQSRRQGKDIGPLRAAFHAALDGIEERVPDADSRKLFASTGLSTASCLSIAEHVRANAPLVSDLISADAADALPETLSLLLDGLAGVDEVQPRATISKDYQATLALWIEGRSLSEIESEMGVSSDEELAEFIEEFFAYLLPWGMTGYLAIAAGLLGHEPSAFVRTLPSLVKFGVPTAEAVWAMSYGIVSRRVALALGDLYRRGASNPSAGGFRRWFAALEPEGLADALGIAGAELEWTARAAVRSHRSELIARLDGGAQLLPLVVDIAIRPGIMERLPQPLREGEAVALVRDLGSGVNRSALRVEWHSVVVGYMPRDAAQALALEMDAGLRVAGLVEVLRTGDDGRIRARVTIDRPTTAPVGANG